MDERITQHINRIKNYLEATYGEKIKGIILYGSYARGTPTKDSDIDLLVIVDKSIEPSEVRKSLSDLLFDILLEHGDLFSVVVLHEDFFLNHNYPFLINVKKEGIRV